MSLPGADGSGALEFVAGVVSRNAQLQSSSCRGRIIATVNQLFMCNRSCTVPHPGHTFVPFCMLRCYGLMMMKVAEVKRGALLARC